MRIINTSDWPIERLAGYGPPLTAAMRRLAQKYPDDLSPAGMMADIVSGAVQLWLILDDAGQFIAFVTTRIEISPLSGRKRVILCDLAGEGGAGLALLTREIEAWAAAQGICEIDAIGRAGWQRSLGQLGYRPVVFRYRKVMSS